MDPIIENILRRLAIQEREIDRLKRRELPASALGGSFSDHDHSGDSGDGGTFDAANLTSGAAGDGTVLTADGSAGAAWEALPALDDHDHSGDAGDGGTFDAANLTSGAADDGFALTADGVGGAAWEVVVAGSIGDHDHSGDAGDGGQLDWDSIWADAVHDHSSDAEGSAFDAANLTSGAAGDGTVLTADGSAGAAWEALPASGIGEAGWYAAGESWTYASADDPTFTFTIAGDLSGKYSAGMRIKLTQTTVKYFIITKVAYSDPNTTITVYGGTDYDLADAAISNNYYAVVKAPFGFPLDPLKWMVSVSDTADRTQATPGQNTWYNPGSITISIPIGCWEVSYRVHGYVGDNSGTSNRANITLSTANNSESDTGFTASFGNVSPTGNIDHNTSPFVRKYLILATKTAYYLNIRTTNASMAVIGFLGANQPTVIDAICAYL